MLMQPVYFGKSAWWNAVELRRDHIVDPCLEWKRFQVSLVERSSVTGLGKNFCLRSWRTSLCSSDIQILLAWVNQWVAQYKASSTWLSSVFVVSCFRLHHDNPWIAMIGMLRDWEVCSFSSLPPSLMPPKWSLEWQSSDCQTVQTGLSIHDFQSKLCFWITTQRFVTV